MYSAFGVEHVPIEKALISGVQRISGAVGGKGVPKAPTGVTSPGKGAAAAPTPSAMLKPKSVMGSTDQAKAANKTLNPGMADKAKLKFAPIKNWASENKLKAGGIGAAAVGVPGAAYYGGTQRR